MLTNVTNVHICSQWSGMLTNLSKFYQMLTNFNSDKCKQMLTNKN